MAQVATSFEQLMVLVEPDDTVTLRDFNGNQTRGRIALVTPSSLRLVVDGAARDLTPADVLEIRQRRGDSLANGAIIGAVAGAGFGLVGSIIVCVEEENCAAWVAGLMTSYAALGAGVGVGVDALIRREQTVFRAPARPAARIRVAPIVTKGRRGIGISLRF